jgi:hypothetical protein
VRFTKTGVGSDGTEEPTGRDGGVGRRGDGGMYGGLGRDDENEVFVELARL